MKTGDIVTDSRAQAWTLGALLGEGVWGRTWLVKDDDGHQRVLKAPYEAEDLPPASADRVPLMRASAEEQADLLSAENDLLVTLEDRITLPTGATALLLPWYPTTLHRQLTSGLPLVEALTILHTVTRGLAEYGRNHGNLRPSNILVDPHGTPVLMDLATHSSQSLMHAHDRANPRRKPWAPADRIAPDTWAICQALYAATMLEESDAGGSQRGERSGNRAAEVPTAGSTGLDKVALATLKDRAVARLKLDGANSRFVLRTAERMSTILARGLSKEADPSPPYRFLKAKDLEPRLREVNALTDPSVENVGKLLLSSAAEGEVFQGPAAVGFTVSVAATEGVDDPSDLVCGVRLTDLDAPGDGRVSLEDAQFTVDKHPSGRLRFEFNLPDVEPGRYAVRVAFSVRDSGHEPVVAEGRFDVRPPPGYVPPSEPDPGPAPIQFVQRPADQPPGSSDPTANEEFEEEDEDAPTVQMSAEEMQQRLAQLDDDGDSEADEPGAEIIDAFPRPLAPTGPGTFYEDEPSDEAPAPAATHDPPALAAVPTPAPSEPGSTGSVGSSDPASSPAVARPQPSVTVAGPGSAGAPTAGGPASPGNTGASTGSPASVPESPGSSPAAPAPPPPAPLPAGNEWQSSQTGEADFFADDAPYADSGEMDDALPGAGADDLMGGPPARPSALADLRDRLTDSIRRDSPTFIGVVIAGCFLLVVFTLALLKAC